MNPETIIKHVKLPHRSLASGGIVKQPLIAARTEANEMVARAAAEAEAIRREAEREAQEVRERAYQDGYAAALGELNRHLLEACARRDRLLAEAEQEILRLSVRIAEKIVGHELDRNQAIVEIVKTALRQARQSRTVTIRLNPSDLPIMQAARERLGRPDQLDVNRFIELVADPQIGGGGCVIETESGTIDARLETQFRILEDAMLSRFEARVPTAVNP
jgi:type III secretion system HrpE/YscL family protein